MSRRAKLLLCAFGVLALAALAVAALAMQARHARTLSPEDEAGRWRLELASTANLHLAISDSL